VSDGQDAPALEPTHAGPEIAQPSRAMDRPRLPNRVSGARRAIQAWFADERLWLAIYLVVAVIATGICIAKRCNNFLIFRAAFDHLVAGRDLYRHYPGEHVDLFKYSPTFALVFAPFAVTPFAVALLAWNAVNVVAVFEALRLALPRAERAVAIPLVGFGLITTVDGTQSNGLVAALIVLAFVALERARLRAAAVAIVLGALVKIFPLCAAAFVIPRSDRRRFFVGLTSIGAVFVALPLLVTSPATLAAQYQSWFSMSSADAADRGGSVMQLLHVATGYTGPNWPIQLAGTLLLLLPLTTRPSRWVDAEFRRGFLASLLVYCVIFNHKAEQPSFVIAIVGVAIWFALSPRERIRQVLTAAAFLATIPMLVTVAAPGLIAPSMTGPLLLTSASCTLTWLAMQTALLDLFPSRAAAPSAGFTPIAEEAA
jgi:hypothetical protein